MSLFEYCASSKIVEGVRSNIRTCEHKQFFEEKIGGHYQKWKALLRDFGSVPSSWIRDHHTFHFPLELPMTLSVPSLNSFLKAKFYTGHSSRKDYISLLGQRDNRDDSQEQRVCRNSHEQSSGLFKLYQII